MTDAHRTTGRLPLPADVAEEGARFVAEYDANVRALVEAHAYDPADEHDACGVGFVAALDGQPRRDVVQAGIDALKAVWHRGAVDADGKTGDGAGIHVQIPQEFFRTRLRRADLGGDHGADRLPHPDERHGHLAAQEVRTQVVIP